MYYTKVFFNRIGFIIGRVLDDQDIAGALITGITMTYEDGDAAIGFTICNFGIAIGFSTHGNFK